MAKKKHKGHDKQKALLLLRLEFIGVENMKHATLEQMKDAVRKVISPFNSFMGYIFDEQLGSSWDSFVKGKKKHSNLNKSILGDRKIKRSADINILEQQEIYDGSQESSEGQACPG